MLNKIDLVTKIIMYNLSKYRYKILSYENFCIKYSKICYIYTHIDPITVKKYTFIYLNKREFIYVYEFRDYLHHNDICVCILDKLLSDIFISKEINEVICTTWNIGKDLIYAEIDNVTNTYKVLSNGLKRLRRILMDKKRIDKAQAYKLLSQM